MKAERIVLSLIAIFIGLFVAGVAFYFYQMASQKPPEKKQIISILPTPTLKPTPSLFSIDSPENEAVSDKKTITISGKSQANTIVISTENGQDVITPDKSGAFSTTVTLDEGVNLIHLTAITDIGKEESRTLIQSYSS